MNDEAKTEEPLMNELAEMHWQKADYRTIMHLKPGDHACCVYETEEERQAALSSLLRRGLEQTRR